MYIYYNSKLIKFLKVYQIPEVNWNIIIIISMILYLYIYNCLEFLNIYNIDLLKIKDYKNYCIYKSTFTNISLIDLKIILLN